ncbi:site-2 protease family protein [Sabulicella glaciei]|uniref:Site-2 protease family protein n=1 Tax=Sabulicella glaciei TaxID=2984948 RepID=A0ABT3NVZ4_9PROT|nr:site-2 protease family protein [Roseococcus sp. MDT2-1-1]MCW8086296.1 site-2 protease family protein [Roseococcus sp. MDT2-1-1]
MDPAVLPELLAAVLATVIAITLHEAAHGYAALGLGDDTAARLGRVSLNPLRHVDPIGTVLLPGFLLISQLLTVGRVEMMFGWAKPVPVDIRNLRDPKTGMMWVAAAGPATNFLLAFISALLLHVAGLADSEWLFRFLGLSILANLVLGLFNLFPIPPLDGGRILVGLLPMRPALAVARLERHGLFIVIGVLFLLPLALPWFRPMDWFVRELVRPAFNFILRAAGLT